MSSKEDMMVFKIGCPYVAQELQTPASVTQLLGLQVCAATPASNCESLITILFLMALVLESRF
jgi:hypothetical protein